MAPLRLETLLALLAAAADAKNVIDASVPGRPLRRLRALGSPTSSLNVTLTVDVAELRLPGFRLWTRTYDGDVPGPTLRTRPDQALHVTLDNQLSSIDNDKGRHGNFKELNTTSLHFHGIVPKSLDGRALMAQRIEPGARGTFSVALAADHATPGFGFFHPHWHGSSTVQTAGGMSGLIFVDGADDLRDNFSTMPEVPLHVLFLPFDAELDVARMQWTDDDAAPGPFRWRFNRDVSARVEGAPRSTLLVNGRPEPVIRLDAGRWYRFRVLCAGTFYRFFAGPPRGCEWRLLAKDGVPVGPRAPRALGTLPLYPGSRADVLVRCEPGRRPWSTMSAAAAGVADVEDADVEHYVRDPGLIATLVVRDAGPPAPRELTELGTFAPRRPCYLNADAPVGARRTLALGARANTMNGAAFAPTAGPLADVPRGAVVQYDVEGAARHPVHWHGLPVRLVGPAAAPGAYLQAGDWHDTLMVYRANVTVVQRVVFPAGATMLVHCHTLQHADYGLMGYLRVGAGAAPCAAGARASDGSCAVGALLVAAAVVLVAYASVRNYVVAVSKEPRLLAEYRLGPLQ